jgi:uncharacterized protein YkwD
MPTDYYRRRAVVRLTLIVVLLAIAGAVYFYSHPFGNSAEHSVLDSALSEVQKSFSAPPPLRAPRAIPKIDASTLTRAGVIAETNRERNMNGGLAPLSEDALLDEIATRRLNDMFQKQYFAHVAPDGGSATTVAAAVGYDYLAIGENLALGYYAGDRGVIDAWMNSPGHRENILETHYTEIGVAVRKGIFEGETTWIAVQIFGRPASDCAMPTPSRKTAIEAGEAQLTAMEQDLQTKKADIDATRPKYGSTYDQKVDAYNAEVAQYNDLAATMKTQVAQYNAEVQAFNACLSP